jgi:tetratricopeptide (TPR) repeat protein
MFNDSDLQKNPKESKTADLTSLKHLADLAEQNGQVFMASGYHKDRVSKYAENLSAWYDFGTFSRRHGMNSTAQECFKEILSIDAGHLNSLIAYGAICGENEQFEKARVFFHTAVDRYPQSSLAFSVLALFYDILGEEDENEKYLCLAVELCPSSDSIFITAAKFLVECHAGQLTERAISEEMLTNGPSIKAYLLLAQLEQQRGNFDLALENIMECVKLDQCCPDVWSALGISISYLRIPLFHPESMG